MKLLAIDTSTERASVAIEVDGIIYSEEQEGMRQHAKLLLPMIEKLLALAKLSCSQLDAIVFGCGPGSFTGLRVACSIAKGLAYAHDLPVYPVSSLAAIAYETYQTPVSGAQVLAMIDARMHQVYWGYFTGESYEVAEQVASAPDIILPSSTPIILAGTGLETYRAQLPKAVQSQIIKESAIFPDAKAMIQLVKYGKIRAVSAVDALPMYVRNQVTQGEEPRG